MKPTTVEAEDGYPLSAHAFGDSHAARAGDRPPDVRARYAGLRLPILSLSFADDEYLSQRNIESLHGHYSGAALEMLRIAPHEIGVPDIGHFGFFRRRFEPVLWPRAGEWLDRQVESHH